MTVFKMYTGLPASGKSTLAKNEVELLGGVLISSDEYREKQTGDRAIQGDNNQLFELIHKDIIENLQNGKNVIFDATNLSRKKRVALLDKLKNIPNLHKECILVATQYEKCLKRNKNLDRVAVPDFVLNRMWKSFDVPMYQEGFDVIEIVYDYNKEDYLIGSYLKIADKFDQKNPHHSMTLGEHSRRVLELVQQSKVDYFIELAAVLHDNGKLHTQTDKNMKGVVSDVYHYYGHENCGAYEALFYLADYCTNDKDVLFASALINYHMRPYGAKTNKAKKKLIETIGEDMYYFLMILHEADRLAH